MSLSTDDIVQVHASFGSVDELLEQRRAVYLAAIELLAGRAAAARCSLDVLDNPLGRGHLGEVLSGTAAFSSDRLQPMSELVERTRASRVHGMWIAGSSSAGRRLEPALRRIGGELGSSDRAAGLRLLTSSDGGFNEAYARLVGGVGLLLELAPRLGHDLIRHVALLAVLKRDGAEALGSASAREFPGLVIVPEPASDLEVAEALVHEGAHQKFFELGVTRDLLVVPPSPPPMFEPSWATSAPHWPVEQAAAAFHAYCCLAALFSECRQRDDLSLHSFSLLPAAARRAAELGAWLDGHGDSLGIDGRRLVARLQVGSAGRTLARPDATQDLGEIRGDDADVVVRRCGNRTLVARRAQPIEMFWLYTGDE